MKADDVPAGVWDAYTNPADTARERLAAALTVHEQQVPQQAATPLDCRSPEGVTVGLIDGIIATARILRTRDTSHPAVTDALHDLAADEDVAWLRLHGKPQNTSSDLATRLQQAAYTLACIPYPDRPLTDDQAAEIVAAAHLLLDASFRLDEVEDQVAAHRRARLLLACWLVTSISLIAAVVVTIATH